MEYFEILKSSIPAIKKRIELFIEVAEYTGCWAWLEEEP